MRRAILLMLALPAALGSVHCGSARPVAPPSGPSLHSPPVAGSPAEITPPADAAIASPEGPGQPPPPAAVPVNFDDTVRPILEARCQPCHFAGGKMYEQLPFDSPETIRDLGTRLFTRIREPEEQAVIRAFLGPPADTGAGSGAEDQPPR